VAAVGAVIVLGFTDLPRATAALPAIARHAMRIALPEWGQAEVVNEIVYGSRGFDTFGETFLLLAAVVSVTTLTRPREPRRHFVGDATAGRGGGNQAGGPGESGPDTGADSSGGEQESQARAAEREEAGAEEQPPADADQDPLGTRAPERAAAMTVVVRVAAKIAAVVLVVASVYLAAWGYTPGSGFPAGAAISGVIILLYAAFGHRAVRWALHPDVLEPIEIFGALVVIAVGLGGLIAHGSLFANFLPLAEPATFLAGGNNRLFAGAELIEVATGLTIATFALLGMRHDWAEDEGEDDGDGDGDG
jgi:multicomponent Na+:H+ antiporter subunit B